MIMGKITAFSFIKIAKGKIHHVIEEISKIKKVVRFYLLTGDYDGLIELEVNDPQELFDVWVSELDSIEGIQETNTHISMKRVELLEHFKE
jgi:DNA-binding Lrp family transcriptional regulator